jgi:hypothetical protein
MIGATTVHLRRGDRRIALDIGHLLAAAVTVWLATTTL